MIRYVVLTVACLYFYVTPVLGKDLGSFGRTYPIAERDALREIEERASQVDWNKVLDRKKVENYQGPPDKAALPRAQKDQVRLVDMTYTSEIDVPDGKGGILYPKGYTFNPLDYITYPKTIVVLNGKDRQQLSWFKDSEYNGRVDVTLLITEGMSAVVTKKVNRTVSYANISVINRFQLKVVPCVIKQKGRYMEVTEVAVPVPTKRQQNI
jgi:conjugal transfer pilus assembly protein TraW